MARIGNRPPAFFTGRAHTKDTGPRYDRLSKADWADAFCDLYCQTHGDEASAEDMMADAERRTELLNQARR